MSHINKTLLCACFVALSMILGYVEHLIPAFIPIYGLKIGFSNFPVIYALFELSPRHALAIGVLKAFLNGMLFSGLMSSFYSVTGVVFAVFGMWILCIIFKKIFSEIGISVFGSWMFQIGQVLTASILLKSYAPFYYLPYLLIGSIIYGIFSGIIIKNLRKKVQFVR